MTYDLAIIVPAYKPDYLREALQSIINQTDPRFSLYILDDASPHNIGEIAGEYLELDQVTYTRFEQNMGGESLVKQWKRCIAQTEKEPWIWLFSDDDIMEPTCVEAFYHALANGSDHPAYRFDTVKITEEGDPIRENQFPDTFDAADFLSLKLSYQQESYIVEYIFSREAMGQAGGIPELPMAWAADDLFCVELASLGEIRSIRGPVVKWRYGAGNISGRSNRSEAVKKLDASRRFVGKLLQKPEMVEKIDPPELITDWYVRQIRSLTDQIDLLDEIKAVASYPGDRKRALKQYLKMKRNRSRVYGWLKHYSS